MSLFLRGLFCDSCSILIAISGLKGSLLCYIVALSITSWSEPAAGTLIIDS